MSDIGTRVKEIIIDKLGVDESEVTPAASFKNNLGADSLDTVELIMAFEKEFNIGIPDDQVESISTVGEAILHYSRDFSFMKPRKQAKPSGFRALPYIHLQMNYYLLMLMSSLLLLS